MVEGTPLLRAQTSKGSRGFESLPLRQPYNSKHKQRLSARSGEVTDRSCLLAITVQGTTPVASQVVGAALTDAYPRRKN